MEIICLCLAVWLCLQMGSENMVLVGLLQIGAKDLTVSNAWYKLLVRVLWFSPRKLGFCLEKSSIQETLNPSTNADSITIAHEEKRKKT